MPEFPGVRFFNIMMAFQQFAGAPLKTTELAYEAHTKELDIIEGFLKDIKRSIYDEKERIKTTDPEMSADYDKLYKKLDKYVK